MTVPNANNEVQVVLTSATQNIPTTFYFLETDNLTVKNTDQATTPATTTLVEGTNYTVTLPATVGGNGSIDMIGATIGDTVTIIRCLDATQLVDYVANDRFPAEVHEKALDRLTMLLTKAWSALFGTNKRFIHYPDTEFGTPTVTPSLSDRIAGGAGTLFGWNAVDGSPDAVSKGVLDDELTLSNSSTLSRPSSDPVNGATQAAINTNFENTWNGVGGLDGDGSYVVKSGTNFLDGNADLNEDITDLDSAVQCAINGAKNLNTRVSTIESAPASSGSLGVFSDRVLGGGSPYNLDVTTGVNLDDCSSIRINLYFNYSGGISNKGAHTGSGYFIFAKVSDQWQSTGGFSEYTGNTSNAPGIADKAFGTTSSTMSETNSINLSSSFSAVISDGNVRITTSQVKGVTSTNLTAIVEVA